MLLACKPSGTAFFIDYGLTSTHSGLTPRAQGSRGLELNNKFPFLSEIKKKKKKSSPLQNASIRIAHVSKALTFPEPFGTSVPTLNRLNRVTTEFNFESELFLKGKLQLEL